MGRLPFDPGKIKGAESSESDSGRATGAGRDGPDHLTVSDLAALIKSTLERGIASPISVVGQISNLSAPNHWYFTLKDENAVASCVAWASSARRFGFVPSDGDAVVATGHVSHYAPQGRTQFYVQKMQPVGAGALQIKFQQLCEQLRAQGYFDDGRKRAIPAFPRRVAVITSAGGAAVHDVIATAGHRCAAVGLVIVDVRVQGAGAAEEVANAVGWVNRRRAALGVDAILVTRGGGSIEDLWAFNEPVVADAVFRSALPVVAAIGHESDTTVIELVADLRAATPTQAAMRLVPDAGELRRQVDHVHGRLTLLLRRRIDMARQRLDAMVRRECIREPNRLIDRARDRIGALRVDVHRTTRTRVAHERSRLERLAGRLAQLPTDRLVAARHARLAVLTDRLDRAVRTRIDQRPRLNEHARRLRAAFMRHATQARERVVRLERGLAAVDPLRVLHRGFSYTTDDRGTIVRGVDAVRAGDRLRTRVADGTIESIASSITADQADAPGATARDDTTSPAPVPSADPAKHDDEDGPDQMDLFARPR